MNLDALLRFDPKALSHARQLCHLACQWPSRAARANLQALADDSHSNLGWQASLSALQSHRLGENGALQLGFSFLDRALLWLVDGEPDARFVLDGRTEADAGRWVDERLRLAGLATTANVDMPYELDGEGYATFADHAEATRVLGQWYAATQAALDGLTDKLASRSVSRPAPRCWPHHFDLAVLFALEHGDPETARSVGIGLSPGDASYAEPYFYCSPWPAPDTSQLPDPAGPWRWHTDGFVSLVATASALDPATDLARTLESAAETALSTL